MYLERHTPPTRPINTIRWGCIVRLDDVRVAHVSEYGAIIQHDTDADLIGATFEAHDCHTLLGHLKIDQSLCDCDNR